jgi:hypothetical protein
MGLTGGVTRPFGAHGKDVPRSSEGLSAAAKDRLPDAEFAFPAERKEPLSDAACGRNAIARFDQVEGPPTRSGTRPGSEYGQRPASSASMFLRGTGASCSRYVPVSAQSVGGPVRS